MTELDITALVTVIQRLSNQVNRLTDEVNLLKHKPTVAMAGGGRGTASLSELTTKDHDLLDGLLDDDHTIYTLADGTRDFTGQQAFTNRANNDAIVLGGATEEGGDIVLYKDAAGTVGLRLDADLGALYFHGAGGLVPLTHLQGVLGSAAAWLGTSRINIMYWNQMYCGAAAGVFVAADSATATVLFRTQNGSLQTCATLDQVAANSGEFSIQRAGDISMLASKSLDAYTNAGYMKPRRLSQSAEPTPEVGELLLWRDTDDDKTYLVYEDTDLGGRKIELT